MTNTNDNNKRDAASVISSTTMLEVMRRVLVGTHSGIFHADEVFGCAILRMAHRELEVFRTRNQARLDELEIVFDVGGVYDPAVGRFDHHQKGGAGVRPNGVPYSSAGLIWKHYGVQVCSGRQDLADAVDRVLIQPVDAVDCGFKLFDGGRPVVKDLGHFSVSAVVSSFNPTMEGATDADYARGFDAGVDFAYGLLWRTMFIERKKLDFVPEVRGALATAIDPRIIELPYGGPGWTEVVCESTEALYVVFRAEGSEEETWMVQCVPPVHGSQEKRRPLPESWGGLRATELAAITGVPDAVFCHIGKFICGAGSREGALALARLALVA